MRQTLTRRSLFTTIIVVLVGYGLFTSFEDKLLVALLFFIGLEALYIVIDSINTKATIKDKESIEELISQSAKAVDANNKELVDRISSLESKFNLTNMRR